MVIAQDFLGADYLSLVCVRVSGGRNSESTVCVKSLGQIFEHFHCGLPDRFVGADLRRGCECCASLLGIAELSIDEPQCQPNSLMCRIRCHAVIESAKGFS